MEELKDEITRLVGTMQREIDARGNPPGTWLNWRLMRLHAQIVDAMEGAYPEDIGGFSHVTELRKTIRASVSKQRDKIVVSVSCAVEPLDLGYG